MKPFRYLLLPAALILAVLLNSFSNLAAVPESIPKSKQPWVIDSLVKKYDSNDKEVKFGGLIAVYVKKTTFDTTITASNEKQIRLWINGFCHKNTEPLLVDYKNKCFVFRIQHDTSATSIWRMFDNYPEYFSANAKDLSICLGTKEKIFPTSESNDHKCKIKLQIRPVWLPWILFALFIAMVAGILTLAPGIIRDTARLNHPGVVFSRKRSVKTDPDKHLISVYDIPFSMARVQLLFWTLVVTLCMIHIWSFTGSLLLPGASVLLLLGISGGTYFVGKIIDRNDAPDKEIDITEFIKKFLWEGKTEGLIPDILSDNKSINLHRLQLLIFTLFIGIQFMASVLFELRFPEMSGTTLAFMGISNGMYAGMKPKENT